MANGTGGGSAREAVYRRRRLVVATIALVLLAAVLTVVTRVSGVGGTGRQAAGQPGSSSDAIASAAASSPASSSGGACDPAVLTVAALTDKTSYAGGEKPVFTIRLTNSGQVACSVDVGSGQLKLVVTSGSQTIWRSADCATGSADTDQYWSYVKTVQPGETLESVGVTWDRVFSDAKACDASAKAVAGGGAAYWLSASVGDVTAKKADRTQFFLK